MDLASRVGIYFHIRFIFFMVNRNLFDFLFDVYGKNFFRLDDFFL